MCGVAAPRSDIKVEYISIAGVPCVRVSRSGVRCKNLVVSFHGGPDSHELDDLRYSGAYREWLDRNVDVLIINYPGSLGFGDAFQTSAWGSWRQSVETVSRAIRHAIARHRYESVVAFGVSFGAWVAAQLGDLEAVKRVVVMSPILSLTEHIERHSPHNEEFSTWASERFGADDLGISLPSNRSHKGAAPVFVLAATNDEIVSPGSTKSVADRATDRGHQWQMTEVPGRHYPASTADAAKRWMVLKELMTQIPTKTAQSRRPISDV
ncbi:S9 family peptidase [Salinibacterium sp. UTAS2018]|uniref:alpha/beta hydrolase family protein n=1 Tax=Salinibacterium sp. UTAS2018 TaxID=2508880 RepID=UPI001FEE317C|nr:prolyl oligopeptidase family serine peptidase [Salinibacterium sp. UTAS2018]